ncbi:type II secretion system minor pseudopilin GspJ [Thalassotalea euphylliae]|uniref:type II secretion system minor pseudopilin GspJ n=1 Tax=Thalassotalea euphylliae TaxID=1655234 RepID=UPI00363A7EAC
MASRLVKGFTLLEVLIAMAIFAVISLSSFTIFDTVFVSDEQSKIKTERLNELNRAFIVMERDFLQIARRTMRVNGEAPLSGYMHLDDQGYFSETTGLAFVRSGWTNPGMLLPRSDLQTVAYNMQDGVLNRLHYNFVDAVVGQEPMVRPLLTGIEDVKFEFYMAGKWLKEIEGTDLPQAVAVILQTEDFGELRRQFLVASEPEKEADDDEQT